MAFRRFGALGVLALPLPLVCAGAVSLAFLACSGLKRADDPADAATEGGDEGGVTIDPDAGGGAVDGATLDAGAPPLDFECPTDPWTKATKGKKECAPRQVKDIEAVATVDTQGISIAHTPAGRVGIAYNSEVNGDEGEMHFVYFTPTTPTYAAPKLITKATGLGYHDGYLSKLAASAPDTLALLTYDHDGVDGEVHFRKLVAGTEPLTDALVATGVKHPTQIGLGSDLAGNTIATYRVSTGATAKLSTKKGTPAGLFTALPDLGTTLHPQDAPGIGATSVFFDPGGQAHLLYHYNDDAIAPQSSQPRYHTLAGSAWSDRKTINNNATGGLSGYSGSIAVFGTTKYAALFSFKSGQSPNSSKYADLLLVSWDALLDMPKTEILDTQIPADGSLYPAYSVVLGVDKYGLLHIAMIIPTDINPNGSSKYGYLEYRRQTRMPDGSTKWLTDIVDPDVISEFSSAFVDMVVDENARPHIAYRSAKDGKVKYATRFDRP